MFAMGMVTFFCLCANVLATVAWFTSIRQVNEENSYFGVEEQDDAKIDSVNLYKFNYPVNVYGDEDEQVEIVDYLTPQDGEVKKYAFNYTHNQFGETVNDVFEPVTIMNVYDPLERVIKQNSFNLLDLNCNAIYEIIFSSASLTNCTLNITASWLSSKIKLPDEIWLTDCVDFDVYFANDLANNNPNFSKQDEEDPSITIDKLYYPSYIPKSTNLTAEEDVYYKISYLASLEGQPHYHFYGNQTKPNSISLVNSTPVSISFDNTGKFKVYVNVNYAPNELDKYQKDIYDHNKKAIYDFSFNFQFEKEEQA